MIVDQSIRSLPTHYYLGLAVIDLQMVSHARACYPYFVLDSITGARIERNPSVTPELSTTQLAFAGMSNGIVLSGGIVCYHAELNLDMNARSPLGLSSNNRFCR